MKARWRGALVTGGLCIAFARDASAIPTFARKFRTSCTTCHEAIPKLNSFGEAFRKNGYRIPGGSEAVFVKEEPVYLGAEAWKQLWPDAIWPGAIPGTVPISLRVEQRLRMKDHNTTRGKTSHVDFRFPSGFEMLSGGTLGENIPFFGNFVFVDDAEASNEVELLQIGYYDLFSRWLGDQALNVKIGRMRIAVADPFRETTHFFLTDPLVGSATVGSSTFHLADNFSAIELDGILKRRFYWATGVTNGEGGNQDVNDRKDLYYRLAYKLGGMALDGSVGGSFGESLGETGGWSETSLTLGSFGYFGRSTLGTAPDQFPDPLQRVGVDARLRYKELDLIGVLAYGHDHNAADPDPSANHRQVSSRSWLLETDYPIYPWWLVGFRTEGATLNQGQHTVRYVPNITFLPRANIRLTFEALLHENEKAEASQYLADLLYVF